MSVNNDGKKRGIYSYCPFAINTPRTGTNASLFMGNQFEM